MGRMILPNLIACGGGMGFPGLGRVSTHTGTRYSYLELAGKQNAARVGNNYALGVRSVGPRQSSYSPTFRLLLTD